MQRTFFTILSAIIGSISKESHILFANMKILFLIYLICNFFCNAGNWKWKRKLKPFMFLKIILWNINFPPSIFFTFFSSWKEATKFHKLLSTWKNCFKNFLNYEQVAKIPTIHSITYFLQTNIQNSEYFRAL